MIFGSEYIGAGFAHVTEEIYFRPSFSISLSFSDTPRLSVYIIISQRQFPSRSTGTHASPKDVTEIAATSDLSTLPPLTQRAITSLAASKIVSAFISPAPADVGYSEYASDS